MKDSLILVSSLFIGLVLISSGFVIHASASGNWVGNDNGEFGYPSCGGCKLDYGDAEIDASFTNNMAYTSPNGYVSLQYNPDKDTSNSYQTGPWYGGHDWFQSAIIGASSGSCSIYTVQVYNLFWGSTDFSWFYNNGNCVTLNGLFTNGAGWTISEYTDASGMVDEVLFAIGGGGSNGGSFAYYYYVPTSWYWLRSNICWCGVNYGSATFSSPTSGEMSYYWSDNSTNFGPISPPIDIATAEDSNMQYGCFSNYQYSMFQSFGLSGEC